MENEKSLISELPYLTPFALNHFIDEALKEDIGNGDHSTLASIPASRMEKAQLKVKDQGILAGLQLAEIVFHRIDPRLRFQAFFKDGDQVQFGDIAFEVEGPAQSILSAERLVLNCMQRMSGVATKTRAFTEKIKGSKATLLDTRKTSPNSRIIEKWAVFIGGGKNHRFALYDMIMLKDNHIDYAGGITQAVKTTRDYLLGKGLSLKIEVETRDLEEVKEALACGGIDFIMLDNFSLEKMKEAVDLVAGKVPLEASGNVNLETISGIAATGVDFISVGALTYTYSALDLSLKAKRP
jgi:nicotinate-nucleotide pyrophosphorylase (carboxylating)